MAEILYLFPLRRRNGDNAFRLRYKTVSLHPLAARRMLHCWCSRTVTLALLHRVILQPATAMLLGITLPNSLDMTLWTDSTQLKLICSLSSGHARTKSAEFRQWHGRQMWRGSGGSRHYLPTYTEWTSVQYASVSRAHDWLSIADRITCEFIYTQLLRIMQ